MKCTLKLTRQPGKSTLEKAAEWTHLGYQNSVMPNLLAVDKMPIWQVDIYLAKVMSFEPQQ